MIQNFTWPKSEDELDDKLIRDVIDHKCHIVSIPEGAHGPKYSFSIGLFVHFEHPELVIFGIDHNIAATAINDACTLIERGHRFKHGDSSDEIFEGVNVMFMEVQPSFYSYYLGTAIWFYKSRSSSFPVLQVVWPDTDHKFPWEKGCDPRCRKVQPVLQEQNA